ncbi:MAG: 50S ribosomal protein L3 [Oscillospiraceae bacterium]
MKQASRPVTVIEAGPCTVTGKMTTERKAMKPSARLRGRRREEADQAEKGTWTRRASAIKHLKEFRLEDCASVNVGDVIKADTFKEGDKVDITGISKGHGYAGVIKRFGQGRTPTSHGGGPVHRHAGSMGSSTDPSRIFPGKKQAGHMGVDQVTVQNLDVVKVDPELNMIVVRGAIPGPKGGIVYIKSTVKKTVVKKGDAGISTNPQKASGRNPQKASARK